MSTYKIDFKQIRLNPNIADMLDALSNAFDFFGIDYYLVGAVARDVWMMGIHNKTPRKTTGDIDFAILINDKGVYEKLRQYLIETTDFVASHENAFVLIWKNKTQVDLLPFGAIENEDRKVIISGNGFTSIDVPGFREIYDDELPHMVLAEKHHFKCCTLPGIVLLKLLAWDDRPEIRSDDIIDICDILHHFFDMFDTLIWENHADLFDNEQDLLRSISARVLGREMKKIAIKNENLYNRMLSILNKHTEDIHNSKLAELMTSYFSNTMVDNVYLLQQVKRGFLE